MTCRLRGSILFAIAGILLVGGGLSVVFRAPAALLMTGLAAAPLVALLILAEPEVGLGLCVLLAYTNVAAFSRAHLFLILGVLTTVAWLIRLMMRGEVSFVGDQSNALVFGFALVAWMSMLFAKDISRSLGIFWGLMRAAAIYFLIIQLVRDRLTLRFIMWVIVLASLLTVLAGSYNLFLGGGVWSAVHQVGAGIRTGSTMRDPNFWAMVLVGAIPFAVLITKNEKALLLKVLGACCALLLIAGVFFTFSRGGFLALIVVVALVAFRQFRRPLVGIAVLCAVLAAFLLLLPRAFVDRFKSLFLLLGGEIRGEASFSHRLTLAKAALDVFLRHPVFGVGLGNFLMHAPKYTVYPMVAHNMYLAVAAGTGALGTLLFLAVFGRSFASLSRSQRIFAQRRQHDLRNFAECVRISLVGLMIAGIFLSVPFKLELWISVGLAVSLKHIAERNWGGLAVA